MVCGVGGGGRQRTRLLLFAMKRSLVGWILVCLLESKRGSETEEERERGGGGKEYCKNIREK